jgi:uncharacterized protein YbaR (Trm112 family)
MAEPFQSEFEARFTEVCALLACPACGGKLRLEAARVLCQQCSRIYPVVDGIPVLMAEPVKPDGSEG